MKKIIFFDGDGTLWYPSATKRSTPPHWVYKDLTITNPIAQFIATPTAIETLRRLHELGVKAVLLSTSPLPESAAIEQRTAIAKAVGVFDFLDAVHVAPEYVEGKGERILALLDTYGIARKDALMVGDTYRWDYESAEKVGVDGLLIKTDYQQEYPSEVNARVIRELEDVITLIY